MSRQGRHGEARFSELCTDPTSTAVAVVNVSKDDEHGWDHIVEITRPQDNRLPADLRVPLITCFAQIKTTREAKPKTTVKLSNAVKAAKSPAPSFVFLFHYRNSGDPILYGRHVWCEEITYILKRARKAGDAPLHKKTVTIAFDEGDRLDVAPPDWILAVLGSLDGMAYAAQKGRLVETVGYEPGSLFGTFTIGPLTSAGDLVEHEVGLLEDLPFSEFALYDQRFGITTATPIQALTSGRVSFTSEGRPLTMRLISPAEETFDLPALGWAPFSAAPGDPEYRFRVRAGQVEFIFSGLGTSQISMTVDSTASFPLLQQLGLLMLQSWGFPGPVEVHIESEIGRLCSGSIRFDKPMDRWLVQIYDCAQYVLALFGRERCAAIEISLIELGEAMRNAYQLAVLHANASIRLEGKIEGELPEFDALVGYSYGALGDWSYGALHELTHRARSRNGDRQSLFFSHPKIVRTQVYKRPLEATRSDIEGEFESYRTSRTDKVASLANGDLTHWFADYPQNADLVLWVED